MKILGIETSCDDTSAAVVEGNVVLSNVTASQDALHAEYGGVVPELAARRHLETIQSMVSKALSDAELDASQIDAIAVTRGPGLVGSLLVGVSAAQGLGLRLGRPVIGVNHLEGHVLSPLLDSDIETPFLAVLVSGGHTAVYLVREIGDYVELTATRDDSAGEAFDKGAKMLGLGYPGGRVIDELARAGDPTAFRFPRAQVRSDPLALSFSGLKTSLWDFLHSVGPERSTKPAPTRPGRVSRTGARSESAGPVGYRVEDVCASFQEAIVDVLVDRTRTFIDRFDVPRVSVAGGVSANSRLRSRMAELATEVNAELFFPPMSLCTDNAAMIAGTAALRLARGLPGEELRAVSRLPLGPRLSEVG